MISNRGIAAAAVVIVVKSVKFNVSLKTNETKS